MGSRWGLTEVTSGGSPVATTTVISKAMAEVVASAALTGFVTASDNGPDVCGHQSFKILFHIPFPFPQSTYEYYT